jgi:Arc/MetJ-type ribon-helix-helix transcriptional regulator
LEHSYGTVAGMARKQVIVQLDDDLLGRLDRTISATGISRSEAIRRAVRAYLDVEWEREADRRYTESYREHPEGWEWDDEYAAMARRGEKLVPGKDGVAEIAKIDETG